MQLIRTLLNMYVYDGIVLISSNTCVVLRRRVLFLEKKKKTKYKPVDILDNRNARIVRFACACVPLKFDFRLFRPQWRKVEAQVGR